MAVVYPLIADFRRGEATPLIHAAVDTETYKSALAKATNWLISRYSGCERRPGGYYQNDSKHGALVVNGSIPSNPTFRLIEFIFSETQSYALEVGHQYIRFHTPDGRVESGGTPVEVTSPYDEADIWDIKFTQSGDVVYLVCDGYEPRTLTRVSETSWTLAVYYPKNGPWQKMTSPRAVLTPSATGSPIPKMTSNTAPTGTATSYFLFDNDNTTQVVGNGASLYSYTFDNGAPNSTEVINAYAVHCGGSAAQGYTPPSWRLEGYDGTNWVLLDTRTEQTGWTSGETRFYEFDNEVAYEAYRIQLTGSNDPGVNNYVTLSGFTFSNHPDYGTDITLTASAQTGINNGDGFKTTDVGRPIRLKGTDNRWRWAKITVRNSATSIDVRLQDHALMDTKIISDWQLGVWSADNDYPSAIGFFQDRLVVNGPTTEPLRVDMTRNADYDNFGVSEPLVADDGVSLTLSGGKLNKALWFVETEELVIGTEGGVRIIGPNDTSNAFSATNARQQGQTAIRAAAIQPVLIDRTVLFVEKQKKALYETAFTFEANGYVAYELTWLAEHLFRGKIREMVFQHTPSRVLWVLCEDGCMAACTYDRENKVFGVAEVTFASGTPETISVLPASDGDRLLVGLKVETGTKTGRYIVKMEYPWNSDVSFDPCYFDCAVAYSGGATTTMSGLDHLDGLTVGVYADGVDIGDATVSSGSITLPDGVSATEVIAGLRISSYGKTLRPASVGQRDGGHLGRAKRIVGAWVDVLATYGLKIGTLEETRTVTTEDDYENNPSPPVMLTGPLHMNVDDSNANEGVFVFETDRAYPATVRALQLEIEGEP